MSMTVQTHPDRFKAVLFDGPPAPFVIVRAFEDGAAVSLFLTSAGLCDALIAAAVEAKRLLDPPAAPSGMQSPAPAVRAYKPCVCNADPGVCDADVHGIGEPVDRPGDETGPFAEPAQAMPEPGAVCGERSGDRTPCTREPGHKGGHVNEAAGKYWQAEEAATL